MSGLAGGSAIVADGIASYRQYGWRASFDLYLTYSLILDWAYFGVSGTPGTAGERTGVLYDRLTVAPGFTYFQDAGLAWGGLVGLGGAWPVLSANAKYADSAQFVGIVSTFGRARVFNAVWVEMAVIWVPFAERHYRFDAGNFTATPTRVGTETGEIGVQFGLRIGNHTYPRYR
jgi:hypothetical protein